MNKEHEQQKFEQVIKTAFESMPATQANERLLSQVVQAIYRKQLLYFRLKMAMATSMVVAFSASTLYWGKAALFELSSSESWVLIRMFFSDFKNVASNWSTYSSYFVESLPVTSVIWLMLGLFIALLAFKILIQELAHRPHRLVR